MGNNYSKYFGIIILVLFAILIINILPYINVYHRSISIPSDIFETHQGLISFLTILSAILIFWATIKKQDNDKKKEIRERLQTACQLISQEIEEFKNQLSLDNYVIRDREPEFFNTYFNYDGYESVLHSDLFSHFSKETQSLIKRLYVRIKLHNKVLMERQSFRHHFFIYDDSKERLEYWYKSSFGINLYLRNIQAEISALIREVEKSLSKEQSNKFD